MTDIESLTVNVEVAGRMLGISRPTAYERVKDGSIYSIRLGNRILVPKITIERMLNGQQAGQPATEAK
jgi:excisionase family DNA binding protein